MECWLPDNQQLGPGPSSHGKGTLATAQHACNALHRVCLPWQACFAMLGVACATGSQGQSGWDLDLPAGQQPLQGSWSQATKRDTLSSIAQEAAVI